MATRKTTVTETKMISIVIPTYNRPGLTVTSATFIRKLHPTAEIIIVDQLSSDPISETDQKKLNITYINLTTAHTAKAKNAGLKKTTGEIVFFFDDDLELTKDTISAHLKEYEDEQIIGTAGRVINDGEKIPLNTNVDTGRTNNAATKFSMNFWSTKKQIVDFPYGCNMSFRKKILSKIGGFDESFKIFEEIDIAARARKYGDIMFVPEALAYHHKAASGGYRDPDLMKARIKMRYYYYGKYIAKHVPFPLYIITLLLRSRSAFMEEPHSVIKLWQGFFSKIIQ